MERRVRLVRAPHTYQYNDLDVREEAILSYLGGYLSSIGFEEFDTRDFHLQRDLTFDSLLDDRITDYVVAVRETSENVHYAYRLANALLRETTARVFLYGQTARLDRVAGLDPRAQICVHDERVLATSLLGAAGNAKTFDSGLRAHPYFPTLPLHPWQVKRFKASLETSRGCHYRCSFCFINKGANYSARWGQRPPTATLADVLEYSSRGVHAVSFHDSEFLGADLSTYDAKRRLLHRLLTEAPPIQYMIWCRADTLLRFDNFDLLKKSGLVNVFLGVESFHQNDLDVLRKQLRVEDVLRCISLLRSLAIHVHLSFLTFNRNTSVESLSHNLDTLERLYADNPRYLGLPNFSFSFETTWDRERTAALSGKTYLTWDLRMKRQPIDGACFDTGLEPLMEIYRLLTYEWQRKVVRLNHARDEVGTDDNDAIECWFENLGSFCIHVMKRFLRRYNLGQLTLDNLTDAREELFELIRNHHATLPEQLRQLETYDVHASPLDYQYSVPKLEADEYWSGVIPE